MKLLAEDWSEHCRVLVLLQRVSAISSKPRESCMQRWLEMLFGSIARLCDASLSECFAHPVKLLVERARANFLLSVRAQPNQYLLSNELA